MEVVGIDIGGSGVRAATVSPDGQIGQVSRAVLSDMSKDGVFRAVKSVLERLDRPSLVGFGVPGFMDGGRVIGSPNLPWLNGCQLDRELADFLSIDCHVENDANCATVGGAHLAGLSEFTMLTLGTGVGGGAIVGGSPLRGSDGLAAEFGHLFVGGDAPCGCGSTGCLESYVSATGLAVAARSSGLLVSNVQELAEMADRGHSGAIELFSVAGIMLGRGVSTIINMLSPAEIWIAGSVSLAHEFLEPTMLSEVRRRAISDGVERTVVKFVGPADSLAIVGAAIMARRARPNG